MDIRHDGTQTLIHLLCRPFETHGVLGHLQTGSSYTAGVGCFTRAVEDLCALEDSNRFRSRRHVCTLGNAETSVFNEDFCVGFLNLVLGSTRHGDVARDTPWTLVLEVFRLRILGHVLFDTSAADIFELEDICEFLLIETFLVVDKSVGIGQSEHFRAETHRFLCSKLRYVSCSGDADTLALEGLTAGSQHRFCEIASAVTGSFRTHERTAPHLTFTGQRTGELVTESFVLTEHESDLTTTHTDVTGRNVCIRSDMTLQLGHETLAETHHLSVGFATRREVRTTLGTTHRKGREGIFERLLESQELHDREVHGSMKTDTAFVRTDSAVHLHAETAVDLHFALIIHPRNAEHNHTFGLDDALHHLLLAQIGIRHNHRSYRLNNFFDCLVKLVLSWVFLDEVRHESVHIRLGLFVHCCTLILKF